MALDAWNLDRIITEHAGRKEPSDHVRSQATALCYIADHLSGEATFVVIPSIILLNGALVLDQPIRLAALIDGLADDHAPVHSQQLLDLRVPVPGHS